MSRYPLPQLSMIGNAHVDPAWMWRRAEGMEAFTATCRSALARIHEHDSVIFTCSTAAQYEWLERHEPELFSEIREQVRTGRWEIAGGWWTEADCNLPGGEGILRQALLGMRYFLDRFDVAPKTGYSPDAFGHGAGLPAMLRESGLPYYIFCRPDPDELALPSPLFRWGCHPGSEVEDSVLAYRVPFHYNMYLTSIPKKVSDFLGAYYDGSNQTADASPLGADRAEWALFYGIGNHGGGPTREHLAEIDRLRNDRNTSERPLQIDYSRLDDFMEAADREVRHARVDGGLHLNSPGCYSAAAEIKSANRHSEELLMAAERLHAFVELHLDQEHDRRGEVRQAWERICFNHFHDILCGVAIRPALKEALRAYGSAIETAERIIGDSTNAIARRVDTSGEGETVIFFNPHAFAVREVLQFEFWRDIDKSLWAEPIDLDVTDEKGVSLPIQQCEPIGKIGRDRMAALIPVEIPAAGWRAFRLHYGSPTSARTSRPVRVTEGRIENDHLALHWNEDTVVLEAGDRTVVAGAGLFEFLVIRDEYDTWGHGAEHFDDEIGRFILRERRVVETGALRARMRERWEWGRSRIDVTYGITSGSDAIEFRMRVFWGEPRTMLKAALPLSFEAMEAVAESFYGRDRFPPDGVERPGGRWKVAVGEEQGVAVIDDLTHGFALTSGELRLSILRSISAATHGPHPLDDREEYDYLDLGTTLLSGRIVPIASEREMSTLSRRASAHLVPPIVRVESPHLPATGEEALPFSAGLSSLPENIHLTVLKRSESSGDLIVRLIETAGESTRFELDLSHLNGVVEVPRYGAVTYRLTAGGPERLLATEEPYTR